MAMTAEKATALEIQVAIGKMCLTDVRGVVQELRLTDTQIMDIMDALDAGTTVVKPAKSTRRSVRLSCWAMSTVSNDDMVFQVRFRDLTWRGASFLYQGSPSDLLLGDIVRLNVPRQSGIMELQATVIRSRNVHQSIQEVGVEFVGVF